MTSSGDLQPTFAALGRPDLREHSAVVVHENGSLAAMMAGAFIVVAIIFALAGPSTSTADTPIGATSAPATLDTGG